MASVRANASNPRLRRSGAVKLLQLESSTAYSPFGATGVTRVAWTVIGTLPVVQCVEVRRTGNLLTGIHVQLLTRECADRGRRRLPQAHRKRNRRRRSDGGRTMNGDC